MQQQLLLLLYLYFLIESGGERDLLSSTTFKSLLFVDELLQVRFGCLLINDSPINFCFSQQEDNLGHGRQSLNFPQRD